MTESRRTVGAANAPRSRRLIAATLWVVAVEVILTLTANGRDMFSGLRGGWQSDDWLSAIATVWVIPMIVLLAQAYRYYRHASVENHELRDEIRQHHSADDEEQRRLDALQSTIIEVIENDELHIYVQPIVELGRVNSTVGFEALARFPTGSPTGWFAAAAEVGMTVDLELHAIRRALELLPAISVDAYLSVNASPDTIDDLRFFSMFRDVDASRIVVEITETLAVEDYGRTNRLLNNLRRLGVRLAVDDAGAGFASLQHIVKLAPDIIKLDRSLVRNIDQDPSRRALVRAIAAFATEVRATLIAEGVEEAVEADTLREIGVGCAQGFLFARPAPVEHVMMR